jgi:putative ABC transport system permease protein
MKEIPMLKHHLLIAWRALNKQRLYTALNVAGLTTGLACAVLIYVFVRDELRYDRFHEKADRIYRLVFERRGEGAPHSAASVSTGYAPAMQREFPEIETAVRLYRTQPVLRVGDESFRERDFFFADPGVFNVFTFPLLKGDAKTALIEPFSVVLTESASRKYFGDTDPIGKSIRYDGQYDFIVTGVMADVPSASHLKIYMLASFTSLKDILRYLLGDRVLEDWVAYMTYTYVLLPENVAPQTIESRFEDFVKKYIDKEESPKLHFRLQPLTDIHLRSNLTADVESNGSQTTVTVFAVIGGIILLISTINFINLSIASAAPRVKEVGIRKVLGANRSRIARQFLLESAVLVAAAVAAALAAVELASPVFQELSGKTIPALGSLEISDGFAVLLLSVMTALAAGSYPSLVISGFTPIDVLNRRMTMTRFSLKRLLIVVQFAASIALVAATVTVQNQLDFMRNHDLGFRKEQVLVIPYAGGVKQRYEAFRTQLLSDPAVQSVAAMSSVPGKRAYRQTYHREGDPPGENLFWSTAMVDWESVETMGLTVVEGRTFDRRIKTDEKGSFLINETAARALGYEQPIGKTFEMLNDDPPLRGTIIGVVKDFHFRSLHQEIEPIVMRVDPFWYREVAIRLVPGNLSSTIDFVHARWKEFAPDRPFEYGFLDEQFDASYRAEERLVKLFAGFSSLAILIGAMGLFGLASYAVAQRRKEISIRKALGADMLKIAGLLYKEYALLAVVASMVGVPVAYYFLHDWLATFAYASSLSAATFLGAAALAVVIAVAATSVQVLRAAGANPVDHLRTE